MNQYQEKISSNIIIEICEETIRSVTNTNIISNEIIKTFLTSDKSAQSESIEKALKDLELLQKNTVISIQNKLQLMKELK
jgi:predicted transglutaminase-like protease